jgi:glycosyltransferase involved in cell wall biosynthesis
MTIAPLNIVYLYSEVMPYVITVMKAVRDNHHAIIHCVNWDEQKKTPFVPTNLEGITFHNRSTFTRENLFTFIDNLQPALIVVSGRMDDLYLEAAKHYKAQGIPIVSGCDNQWTGHWKDRIKALLGWKLYRQYFNYLWVPGDRQVQFAKHIGYKADKIIRYVYCADVDIYQQQWQHKIAEKKAYPRAIVFVGRFTAVKGIDLLVEAFKQADKEVAGWTLVLVGAGDKEYSFDSSSNIETKGFMTTEELAINSLNWGVFCLPSHKEPWGVVVHEFAAAGLPLICSDSVGAADAFVQSGENGYIFKNGDPASLKEKLVTIMQKADAELWQMAEKSAAIANVINPAKAADSLMSVLKK